MSTTDEFKQLAPVLAIATAAVGIGLLPLQVVMAGTTPLFLLVGTGVLLFVILGGAIATARIGPSYDGDQTFKTMVLSVVRSTFGHRGFRTCWEALARTAARLDGGEPCCRANRGSSSAQLALGSRGGYMDRSFVGLDGTTTYSRITVARLPWKSGVEVAFVAAGLHPSLGECCRGHYM